MCCRLCPQLHQCSSLERDGSLKCSIQSLADAVEPSGELLRFRAKRFSLLSVVVLSELHGGCDGFLSLVDRLGSALACGFNTNNGRLERGREIV